MHEKLVEHAQLAHASESDEYRVDTKFFRNRDDYEVWRRNEEKQHVLQWAKTSAQSSEGRKVSHYRCSRAIPFPSYTVTQGPRSKKSVPYCTAFLRVSEESNGISVTYCNQHCGHELQPAQLSIDKNDESYIVSMLKTGFSANQILKKIRMEYRSKEKDRLYYTTAKDIRNIAVRHKIEPGRKHELDLKSVEIRVEEGSVDDGIHIYAPAKEESGDGFLLVVVTPVQEARLTRYGRRGVSIDDTFNLTKYSLRLATVIVADEWDMGLPSAYLLSHRSPRVQQWGGFSRVNACMNTSMLGERFHKRLKHELPDSKSNMRLDRLLDLIISLPADMEQDRTIKLNNHCLKGECGACGYGYRCDCKKDIQSGKVTGDICGHVENMENTGLVAESSEVTCFAQDRIARTDILDSNNNLVHEIETVRVIMRWYDATSSKSRKYQSSKRVTALKKYSMP
ncbi:hypothetical protein COOONC_02093 [Cooperia oncophora]